MFFPAPESCGGIVGTSTGGDTGASEPQPIKIKHKNIKNLFFMDHSLKNYKPYHGRFKTSPEALVLNIPIMELLEFMINRVEPSPIKNIEPPL